LLPILTVVTQKIEWLATEMKPVYKLAEKYYVRLVKSEAVLANIRRDDHVLCIGGGICPFSAILFHQMTGAKVTVIDNCEKCVHKAKKTIARLGLGDHIHVWLQDGCSRHILYADYSVVHLALQVYPMEQVFSSVVRGITPGTRLLVRQPRNRAWEGERTFTGLKYKDCVKHTSRNVGSSSLYVK